MKLLRAPRYRQLLNMLSRARQRASLTQLELNDKVAAHDGFVAKYEGGRKGPSRRR